jgi:predicted extracellular nuclease
MNGKISLAAALLALAGSASTSSAALIISEYVEGSSSNKALELFNTGPTGIDLTGGAYKIELYANGSTTSPNVINLTGTVAANATYVVANSSAGATVLGVANLTSGGLTFTGDDYLQLLTGTTVIDSFGQLGNDPGTEWGTGLTSSADNTLRRKDTVLTGDIITSDAFDPSAEYVGFATDTFDGLGSHTVVPEPASLGVVGAGILSLFRRRH